MEYLLRKAHGEEYETEEEEEEEGKARWYDNQV